MKSRRCSVLSRRRNRSVGSRLSMVTLAMLVRTYTYIAMHGPDGLRKIAEYAVLNANYIKARLKASTPFPSTVFACTSSSRKGSGRRPRHPCPGCRQAADGLRLSSTHQLLPAHRPRSADDRAHRDREQGHVGRLCRCICLKLPMRPKRPPTLLHEAPHKTPFGRMDEVKAARELVLCCWLPEDYGD